MLRWLPLPTQRPHRCACLPQLAGHRPAGYFDFGSNIDGEHVYVSGEAAVQMARAMGWAPIVKDKSEDRRVALLQEDVEAMQSELDDVNRQLRAVEVLKQHGFAQQKAPGRPRKDANAPVR